MGTNDHLDVQALAELEDIMEEDFGILLETYIEDANQKVESLDAALADQDAKALRELSHSLKGASCNVGAIPLSQLCETVEQLAKSEQLSDMLPLLSDIRSEYYAVRAFLQTKI